MHRNPGYYTIIGGGILVVLLAACERMGVARGDQGPPDGIRGVEIARKCRQMNFDTQTGNASETLDLKSDGTVLITMHPARNSINWKLKHLASKKGRIIARVVNTGGGDWPQMALAPRDTTCWHVWVDGDDMVHAQWVGLTNDSNPRIEPLVHPDSLFEIKFHQSRHGKDQSQWNRSDTQALSEPRDIFRFASARRQLLLTGNTGWTTCLMNGCCRSRQ